MADGTDHIPTPDEIASSYEHAAQEKLAEAENLRIRALAGIDEAGDADPTPVYPPSSRKHMLERAKELREEALIASLLALGPRVAEVSR